MNEAPGQTMNQDYNDALTFAESDLKTNWRHYKNDFVGGPDEEA